MKPLKKMLFQNVFSILRRLCACTSNSSNKPFVVCASVKPKCNKCLSEPQQALELFAL
ncbi:unnamed protein product [Moneuplotes crassus]|uniref:Uncharacterized protein n=1 Tax=Euplotes crassus TaxID=5936 RepID=A0AAD2CYC5_EUPCR|nr:unnamed protein product [Moneuplotes crassus]